MKKFYAHRLLLTIYFSVFILCMVTAQKDTMHLKSQFVINNSYALFGQIQLNDFFSPDYNTRLAFAIRLRGHQFLLNKFALGAGIKYFDYYYTLETGLDLDKPWNGEIYARYYPFKAWYVETSILYGGFVRDSQYLNKTNWIGSVSIGFETRLKGNFFLEAELRTHYPLEKNSWAVGHFGRKGFSFVGINYYFTRKKRK